MIIECGEKVFLKCVVESVREAFERLVVGDLKGVVRIEP
jgi:hypothetical protein